MFSRNFLEHVFDVTFQDLCTALLIDSFQQKRETKSMKYLVNEGMEANQGFKILGTKNHCLCAK